MAKDCCPLKRQAFDFAFFSGSKKRRTPARFFEPPQFIHLPFIFVQRQQGGLKKYGVHPAEPSTETTVNMDGLEVK
jgi:hypothetical protein